MKSLVASLFLLLLIMPLNAQLPAIAQTNRPAFTWTPELEKLLSDIEQDMETLPAVSKATSLTHLANILWSIDRARAHQYLKRAVEILFDPTTKYVSDVARISALSSILSSAQLFERDPVLAAKVFTTLKPLLLSPPFPADPTHNRRLAVFAGYMVGRDPRAASEFAMASLSGAYPVAEFSSSRYFNFLADQKDPLADAYVEKVVNTALATRNVRLLERFINSSNFQLTASYVQAFRLSDAHQRKVLETLMLFAKDEAKELALGKRQDCSLTVLANDRVENLRALLPSQVPLLRQVVSACDNSHIDAKKKPGYRLVNKLVTSQDYLQHAKTFADPEIRAGWTHSAAIKASDEKNHPLAFEILDTIPETTKYRQNGLWARTRMQLVRQLAIELIAKEQFTEVNDLIQGSPERMRPYIILDLIRDPRAYRFRHSAATVDLLNRARAELLKMDFDPPRLGVWIETNPARFIELVDGYRRAGYPDEAAAALEEFVRLQNKLSSRFAVKVPAGDTISYYASSIDADYFQKNVSFVVWNISQIEARSIRLDFRMNLLRLAMGNGSASGTGVMLLH